MEKEILLDDIKEVHDAKVYWQNEMKNISDKLNFTTDYIRSGINKKSTYKFKLSKGNSEKVTRITRNKDNALFVFLLSLYSIEVSKLVQEDNVTIISSAVNKESDIFFNYTFDAADKMGQVLKKVQDKVKKGFSFDYYPLENLMKDASDNNILDLSTFCFNMERIQGLAGVERIVENNENYIILNVNEAYEGISLELIYNSEIFSEKTIKLLGDYFNNVAETILNDNSASFGMINLMSKDELAEMYESLNKSEAVYDKDKTLHALFSDEAAITPNNTALLFGDKTMTYKELDQKSNQLARKLQENKIGKSDKVAIITNRSFEMIIGIYAVLKAGAAYVPIGFDFPKERIDYILEDSEAKAVLMQGKLVNKIEVNDKEIIVLDDEKNYAYSEMPVDNVNDSEDIAYIIYTSGSTGKPKGVSIKHKSVINTLQFLSKEYSLKEEDTFLFKTSFYFDVSVSEIFGFFMNGGKLCILKKDGEKSVTEILKAIDKYDITHINFVPSMFKVFIDNLGKDKIHIINKLKYIFLAGEEIKTEYVNQFYKLTDKVKLENLYGPTETTIYSTYYPIDVKSYNVRIPIGKPLANTKLFVVNAKDELMFRGGIGELCIAGDGLSKGYVKREDLTKEKFYKASFNNDELVYKTGDLVRVNVDNDIEYIGRTDSQVKIRGFRIELGEINNRVLNIENVNEASTIIKGKDTMVVYFTSDTNMDVSLIKKEIQKTLPAYMIPAYIIQLKEMPVNVNGKIDNKALKAMDLKITYSGDFEAPRNSVEFGISKIWEEVLAVSREISINDNFYELGGDSLKAINIVNRIQKEFNIKIEIVEFLNKPTIKKMMEYIEKLGHEKYEAIEGATISEDYPLTSAQKRMFLLNQMLTETTNYNVSIIAEITGDINIEKMIDCIQKLVDRHEAFRTSFHIIDGELRQKVHDDVKINVSVEKAASFEEGKRKAVNLIRPFDLSKAPLMRCSLFELAEDRYILFVDIHHIIIDGVSIEQLIKEFNSLYEGKELKAVRIHNKDYAVWQSNRMNSKEIQKQEQYWVDKLKDDVPVLNIPTDYPRKANNSHDGASIAFSVGEKETNRLRTLAKENNITLYVILYAAYGILLHKYTHQDEVIVGCAVANRTHLDAQEIIGMFVNMLPIKNEFKADEKVENYILNTKKNIFEAFQNQECQFDELVKKLNIVTSSGRQPLFDTIFLMQNMEGSQVNLSGFEAKSIDFSIPTIKYDILINVIESKNEILFNLEYSTELFKESTIQRLKKHYVNILNEILSIDKLVDDVEMMDEDEKQRLLLKSTLLEKTSDKIIHKRIEEVADKYPKLTALTFEDEKMTYKELNGKANALARKLREKGVRADDIVGIYIDKSMEMIIGILAILKAGGAYLPIKTDYPRERIEYMLEDSKAKILLTSDVLKDKINFKGETILLNNEDLYSGDQSNLPIVNTEENKAYVIYTSGSTGKPKGVIIEHRNVMSLFDSADVLYDFSNKDVWTMFHSYCFDFSVWEMYGALLYGGRLVLISDESSKDLLKFKNILINEKVTVLNQTPSAFYNVSELLLEDKSELSLRYVIFGGEALKPIKLKAFNDYYKKVKLINMYGITETTVHTTFKEITSYEIDNNIGSIGKCIPTLNAYVFDNNLKIVPKGVEGELVIVGGGVTRGYLNLPEMNAKKFIKNPYDESQRAYRSGDLVKLMDNDEFEYLGRIDNQVKIRGFRIEIGEIENALLKNEKVKEAAVLICGADNEDKYLCAYLTTNAEISVEEIRKFAKEMLPEYMVPAYFVLLDKMPINVNGKVDSKKLRGIKINVTKTIEKFVLATTEVEKKLEEIFKDNLGIEEVISINSNYFDLGGNSLKAIKLISEIQKRMEVKVPIVELFQKNNIEDLSQYIGKLQTNVFEEIPKAPAKDYYELSSAQMRMYISSKLESNSFNYNICQAYKITGEVDKEKFEDIFRKLIDRHEALRTSFEMVDGKIVQRIHDKLDFNIEYEENVKDIKEFSKKFVRPFVLENPKLLRVALVKEGDKEYTMLLDIHHIIADGTAVVNLVNEFMMLYQGKELTPLRIQYKDYSEWSNKEHVIESLEKQKKYWIDRFSKPFKSITIPTDYARGISKDYFGANCKINLDKDITDKLKKLATDNKCTLYMLMLAIYNILLNKYTDVEDVIVGTPIAGRNHADLQNMIGMFVNMLPMRNIVKGNMSFKEFLSKVRVDIIDAFANQDYQFNDLINDLKIKRVPNQNPIFDTVFAMQNMETHSFDLKDIEIEYEDLNLDIARFDITLYAWETNDVLSLYVRYAKSLYKEKTIERYLNEYVDILNQVVENPDILIQEIKIATDKEIVETEIEDVDFSF